MENTMDLLNKSKLIDWVVKGDHVVIIQMTHCGDDQGDKIEKSIIKIKNPQFYITGGFLVQPFESKINIQARYTLEH